MLASTMLWMATNYNLQYFNLSTAASPGYPTQFPALNSPLAFLVLDCLGVSTFSDVAVPVKPKLTRLPAEAQSF